MTTELPRKMLLVLTAAILLLVTFGQLPGGTKLWQSLQNAGHAPAFCALSIAILRLISPRSIGVTHKKDLRMYGGTFLVCLLAGVLVEVMQSMIGRDLSWDDVAADTLGILCGLTGNAWLHTPASFQRAQSVALLLSCISCAVLAFAPLGWTVAAYIHRGIQFPVIAKFSSPLDLYFISGQRSYTTLVSNEAEGVLKVYVHPERPGTWPGVTIDEPAPDWSGYETLAIDITNPEDRLLRLNLRVHDRLHNNQFADRYNQTMEIAALTHALIKVPIAGIRAAPQGREMDVRQIAGLIIFGDATLAGRAFLVERIWLE